MKVSKYIKLKYIVVTVLLITSIFVIQMVQAVGEPGSFDNPLVSKDYVDEKVTELLSKINELSQKISIHISGSQDVKDAEPVPAPTPESESPRADEKDTKFNNEMLGELTANILELNQKINNISIELSKINARVISLENGDSAFISTALLQNQKIADVEVAVNSLQTSLDTLSNKLGSTEPQNVKFEIIELKAGKHLVIGDSTEMLLRGGKAVAVASNTGAGGLVDLTSGSGADIVGGQDIPLNHLLMSPRDDGRGLVVASDTAWIMVKGAYTVK